MVLGGGSRGERGEEIDPWWATSGCIPKNVAAVAYFATITNGPTEERNISLLCKYMPNYKIPCTNSKMLIGFNS